MNTLKEYNLKPVTNAEFDQWLDAYDGKSEPPENIKNYAFKCVLAAEQKVDDLYKNIKK